MTKRLHININPDVCQFPYKHTVSISFICHILYTILYKYILYIYYGKLYLSLLVYTTYMYSCTIYTCI